MKLSDYKKKRDPAQTNEPFGPEPGRTAPTLAGSYVVHLHDATRRHYDLRIEIGGVLASFAVPRGISLDPSQKHLAVNTEDHPLDYLDFEAVIPDGQYGAGAMILWDRGRVRYLDGPAEEEKERGKLDLELSGYKLHGRYALVRLKNSAKGNEWLLFKKADAWSSTSRDLLAEQPRSVLSGLTVDELAEAPRIARQLEERAAELGAPVGSVDPRRLEPMLCASEGAPTHGDGWVYELKLDGVRLLARKEGRTAVLTNRRHRNETARYPEVARAIAALAPASVVLDGEIVAFDEQGRPSFQLLGRRMHLEGAREVQAAMADIPVLYVVFDLLAIGERDLRGLPLAQRKELLRRLLPAPGVMRVLDDIEGDGRQLLEFCRERHLEGVVAKRAGSPYRAGPRRTDDWVKMKCERDDEFVVVGWTVGERGRGRLGALDIATYRGEELVYRGKVGSGLDERQIDLLLERMAPLVSERPTVGGKLTSAPRGRTFVRPELVVSVRYLGWTDEGSVRHPVYRGLREDKSARDCTASPAHEAQPQKPPPYSDAVVTARASQAASRPEEKIRNVAITNRTKVLWPGDGYMKQDLWNYYRAVAPMLLRYLHERPIVLVRYPDGIDGKFFFQWNVPAGMPDWIRTLTIRREEEDREVNVFLIDDVESLLYIANLACIPIHILASRADSIDECDFFTIDFDVKNSSLAEAVKIAHTLRELLEALGLPGYPKTSGQTGLHVLVPLGPGVSFTTARALADLVGHLLCRTHPKTATMERVVARRGPRVYVDTGQTGRSRTIVAPYSVRATPGARVSTPLAWDEVTLDLDPARFTITTVPARIAERGDPMMPLLGARPNVPKAVAKLEALSSR